MGWLEGIELAGAGQDLDGLTVGDHLGYFSVYHLDDLIHIFTHAQVVGDHDPGLVLFVDQIGEDLDDLVGPFGVQAGGGFIGQDHAGVVDQGAGDGDPLLLAAGKLAWQVVQAVFQAQTGQQVRGALTAVATILLVQAQHQLDIFEGAQIGHQVVGLEGEADLLAAEAGALDIVHLAQVLPVDQQLPFGGGQQTRQHGQHGGLPGAAGTDQADKLAGLDMSMETCINSFDG